MSNLLSRSWVIGLALFAAGGPSKPVAASPAHRPSANVQISGEKPSIFAGEVFMVDLHVTNTGTTDLKPIHSMFCQFQEQWVVDNPYIVSNRVLPPGACPDRSLPNGSIPASARYVVLKPGEHHDDRMDLYIPRDAHEASPLKLRLGYKDQPDSEVVWSNTISIPLKQDEKFDVIVEATAAVAVVKVSDVLPVSIHISNRSRQSVTIGREICGEHGVIQWRTDQPFIFAGGGSSGCLKNMFPPVDVVLKPQDTYDQTVHVSFNSEAVKPGPVTFRVGLQNVGHDVAWSNPLTVDILP